MTESSGEDAGDLDEPFDDDGADDDGAEAGVEGSAELLPQGRPGRGIDGTGLKRLHRAWRRRTTGRVALLLDGVSSTFNVGSILRTAAAERVDHLWITANATGPKAPGVAKTALGCERYLTWDLGGTGAECADAARAAGYRVVGIELAPGAVPLHELDLTGGPVCLAVGHEDHGLAPATITACDALAFLPQLGRVGSLNVAVAAAIALYEVRRQEWAGAGRAGPNPLGGPPPLP